MQAAGQLWFLKRRALQPLQSIVPALAGSVMLGGSFLPWSGDPWGRVYTAWQIPLDLAWGFHIAWLNYGLLCLLIAGYALLVAWMNWRPLRGGSFLAQQHRMVGVCCFLLPLLYGLQFLCGDVAEVHQFALHQAQVLLIQQHFGYSVGALRVHMEPLALDSSTLRTRIELLINLFEPACLLPALSGWLLVYSCRFFTTPPRPNAKSRWMAGLWLPGSVLLLLICGRGPLALGCEYQSQQLLAAGDYRTALRWLDAVAYLNPELTQTTLYHLERGRANYFLHPTQLDDDSRFYLVEVYRSLGSYAQAYQTLAVDDALPSQKLSPWVQDEYSLLLTELAESAHPLQGTMTSRTGNDTAALPWLHLLLEIDPDNLYAHYMLGRIGYEQQNYVDTQLQLQAVLQLSRNNDIQSSAYTYLGLDEANQGAYSDSRRLLFQAIALDYRFCNNTAREALSGLH